MEQRLVQLETQLGTVMAEFETTLTDLVTRKLDSWLEKTLTISCITEEIERRFRINQADLASHGKETQKLYEKSTENRTINHSQQREIEKLTSHLERLEIELQYRVYKGDFAKLREEACPLSLAYSLESTLQTKATAKQYRKLKSLYRELRNDLERDFYRKSHAKTEFTRTNKALAETFKQYPTKEDLQSGIASATNRSGDIAAEFTEFRSKLLYDVANLTEELRTLWSGIVTKADKGELQTLKLHLSEKAPKSAIEDLYLYFAPQFGVIETELADMKLSIQQQESALARIDELILGKAAKSDLSLLTLKVTAISNHPDLELNIDNMVAQLNSLLCSSGTAQTDLTMLKAQIHEMNSFHLKRQNETIENQFFKDSLQELRTSLTYKSDRSETLNYLECKASCLQMKQLKEAIGAVHNSTKLIAVQLGALFRIWADPFKDKIHDRTQKEFLSKATQKVVDYIMQLRPIEDSVTKAPEDAQFVIKTGSCADRVQSAKLRSKTPRRRINRSHIES